LKGEDKHIDHLIDETIHVRGSPFLSQDEVKKLVEQSYPDLYFIDYGWHKVVFGFCPDERKIVLKVGTKKSIEKDHQAYKRVPEVVRHRFFARIYWHTKYCLLQEYGLPIQVTNQQLNQIRQAVYRYGIIDIKAENLKNIRGRIKIIDANATIVRFPTLLAKVDSIKPKLPKTLVRIGKNLSKLTER
jgi:hypothetical protein